MHRGRLRFGALACASFVLSLSASASAATYCVHRSGCNAAHRKATIQAALDAVTADGRAGTVLVGSGTFNEALIYTGHGALLLDGTGQAATSIVTSAPGGGINCGTAARMTVENLSIRIPGGGSETPGIEADCPLTAISIGVNTEFVPGDTGIELLRGHSIVSHATVVSSETGPDAAAVSTQNGATLSITDSNLLGEFALWATGFGGSSSVVAHRLNITSSGSAAAGVWSESATVRVDDSLIQVSGGASAIGAVTYAQSSTLTARQLTMIGDGSTQAIYVASTMGPSGTGASVNLRDSLMRGPDGASPGFGKPYCSVGTGHTVSINIDYSDFEFPTASPCFGTGATYYQGPHNLNNVNPLFVIPGSDYALRASSPARDRDPAALQPWESRTDLAGEPRIRGFLRDLGAYEFQPAPPGIDTGAADGLTRSAGTVHGVLRTHRVRAEWWVLYGLTTHYGHRTPVLGPVAATAALHVQARLHGLLRNHTYHYRFVASNGVIAAGTDHTFRTLS